ncbi:hypothetical protein BZB76_2098 [Actinomadura pelletieri DSM 43383]|uniref:Uncharacterized protein n=1 Tax=Actinomadura pelletieri DSM 43383 TaxID=1120940 RepID=A0A495QT97_9ACTN|nr:hypothetical protein [Actinomadura pelletieri]RKS76739.1 hypothetical protein BZB76_2098 [Actinomadura pelletieri DSM 43383]
MQRFETASLALIPGERVRAEVVSHQPWGVMVKLIGHEDLGASIDMMEQFRRTPTSRDELLNLYPVGAEIDAVVQQVRRLHPPAWIRLSIRSADLESFAWPCDFCGEKATLSPGGDGLVLDVRSNDGPGSGTFISHRACLAKQISENTGERARAFEIGRMARTTETDDQHTDQDPEQTRNKDDR